MRLLPNPRFRLIEQTQPQMTRPLRSTPITGASPLLRAGPPARPASVLTPSRFPPHGALPLARSQTRTGSIGPRLLPFRAESRRPGSRRLHAGHRLASKREPARLIPGPFGRPGFDATCYLFDTSTAIRLTLALPDPHLTRLAAPFPTSLTTTVFSQSAACRRFEASPRRATPKGQNPSSTYTAPEARHTKPHPRSCSQGLQPTQHVVV